MRHVDRRLHSEFPGCVGDRLAVIASRGGNHAGRPIVRLELAHQIQAAPDLERANGLQVLALEKDGAAQVFAQNDVMQERGGTKVATDGLSGAKHVCQVRNWNSVGIRGRWIRLHSLRDGRHYTHQIWLPGRQQEPLPGGIETGQTTQN